jgi:hypothetical protein
MNINQINEKIDQLAGAEKVTKAILSDLSRVILEYILETEDVQPANRVIEVLTPVNKKASILYFKHFLPFIKITNEEGEFQKFGGKDKKRFDAKAEEIKEFLADPHNNIWTWAARHVEVEAKPYDPAKVAKEIEKAIKKVGQEATIKAIIAGGIDVQMLMMMLEAQANVEEAEEQEAA